MGNPHVMFPVKKDYPYRPIRFPDPNDYPFMGESSTPIAEGEGYSENQCSAPETCEDPATILNRKAHKLDPLFSSTSPEWLTPPAVIEAVVEVLGSIDLDPCASKSNTGHVPAERVYTIEDDGLSLPWVGRVYMNPPYGRTIQQWTRKLLFEYSNKRTTEAIALLPARTDTKWFRELGLFDVCFVDGRLRFSDAEACAPFPSAILCLGSPWTEQRFRKVFTRLGDIYTRVEAGSRRPQ